MILFRKINTFCKLEKQSLILFPEVLLYIFLAQVSLMFYPFNKLSKSIGTLMKESTNEEYNQNDLIYSIGQMIDIVANNLPWEAACYPRALCAKWMLNRRNINSTLYLGVRKNNIGLHKGHAWLRSGKQIVVGKKGYEQYSIIATYA